LSFEELGKKALKAVKEEDIVNLAKELVRIPSQSGDESPIASFLYDYMEKEGIEVTLQQVTDERYQPRAVLPGTGEGPQLLYLGHIDQEPVEYGFQNPYHPRVREGNLYGAGLTNMKAGVAAEVSAIIALKKAGIELKGDLIVNPPIGELQGGVGVRWLIDQLKKENNLPDAVITPHPFEKGQGVNLKRVGVVQMAITTIGKAAHIGVKEEGVDAIAKMWKVMEALYELEEKKGWSYTFDPDLPGIPRMVIGSIIGGRGDPINLRYPSDLSDHCTIITDTRINQSQSDESVKNDVENILKRLKQKDPELEYEIKLPPLPFNCAQYNTPPATISEKEYLVKALRKQHEKITKKPIPIINAYVGSDISLFEKAGIPSLIYFWGKYVSEEGMSGVKISEMVEATKVLILTAIDICSKTKEEYNQARILKP
jgi:acetylornithine deacetylase/succinyl-diaminopimelate desuccinylase-like protein